MSFLSHDTYPSIESRQSLQEHSAQTQWLEHVILSGESVSREAFDSFIFHEKKRLQIGKLQTSPTSVVVVPHKRIQNQNHISSQMQRVEGASSYTTKPTNIPSLSSSTTITDATMSMPVIQLEDYSNSSDSSGGSVGVGVKVPPVHDYVHDYVHEHGDEHGYEHGYEYDDEELLLYLRKNVEPVDVDVDVDVVVPIDSIDVNVDVDVQKSVEESVDEHTYTKALKNVNETISKYKDKDMESINQKRLQVSSSMNMSKTGIVSDTTMHELTRMEEEYQRKKASNIPVINPSVLYHYKPPINGNTDTDTSKDVQMPSMPYTYTNRHPSTHTYIYTYMHIYIYILSCTE